MDIGKLGLWQFLDTLPSVDAAKFVQRIEELGYPALWLPEAVGREPFAFMRQYLDAMHTAPFFAVAPSETPPTVIGAIRPKMLALAAEKTTGSHTYFVPPEHTARSRKIL